MNYRNPVFIENGWIDCEIEHPVHGWTPFTCDPNDTGAQFDTAALFAKMQPHAAPYVPPTQEELDAMAAAGIRAERDYRLATEVDPIAGNALRWATLTAEQRQAWADYRQALLDVPQQASFPHDVVWPTKPE
jgi:hypothetical protein